MADVLLDSLIDSLKILPLLFLAYLGMEFIEHRFGEKTEQLVRKAGRLGPAVGGLLGVIPQCGFSVAASGLYAGRVITAGTIIAIFLSTSDEMLPVMISARMPLTVILKILCLKAAIGMICGFLIDTALRRRVRDGGSMDISGVCTARHCNCEESGIFLSAVRHTASIILFIFIVTLAMNMLIFFVGEDAISSIITTKPFIGPIITGLVGLIPNCASSVIITQLYVDHVINAGSMLAGLLTGSGMGLLVLFRTNKRVKENLYILLTVYVLGVAFGLLIELLGVAF